MTSYSPEDVYMLTRRGDVDNLMIALKQGNNSRDWSVFRNIDNDDDDDDGTVAIHAAAFMIILHA